MEAQVEALKKILKDKEGEITEVMGQLRQAKEDAVREYHDFDYLLKELDGFLLTVLMTAFGRSRPFFLT